MADSVVSSHLFSTVNGAIKSAGITYPGATDTFTTEYHRLLGSTQYLHIVKDSSLAFTITQQVTQDQALPLSPGANWSDISTFTFPAGQTHLTRTLIAVAPYSRFVVTRTAGTGVAKLWMAQATQGGPTPISILHSADGVPVDVVGGALKVTGDVTATVSGDVSVSGTVNIGNAPHVVVDSAPAITGTVVVSGLPAVSGKFDTATSSSTITTTDAGPVIGYGSVSGAVPTTGSTAAVSCAGYGWANITLSGTWTGNLLFEATSDNTNWFTVNAIRPGPATTGSLYFANAPGVYSLFCARFSAIRIRATTATGGVTAFTTATVHYFLSATSADDPTKMVEGSAGNGGTPARNPLTIAGVEQSTSKVRWVSTDIYGLLAARTLAESVADGVVTGNAGRVACTGLTAVANTDTLLNRTAYVEQAAGGQRSIVSTSPLDTAAGTGARTARITYFAETTPGVVTGPFTEDKTLNGTIPVNTVATNIKFIESIELLTVGSGGTNAGVINLFSAVGGGGVVFASIAIGDRRTLYGHHYVPTGVTCRVVRLRGDSDTATGNVVKFSLRSRNLAVADSADISMHRQYSVQGSTGTKEITFPVPPRVVGPAIIRVYANGPASGTLYHTVDLAYYEA